MAWCVLVSNISCTRNCHLNSNTTYCVGISSVILNFFFFRVTGLSKKYNPFQSSLLFSPHYTRLHFCNLCYRFLGYFLASLCVHCCKPQFGPNIFLSHHWQYLCTHTLVVQKYKNFLCSFCNLFLCSTSYMFSKLYIKKFLVAIHG